MRARASSPVSRRGGILGTRCPDTVCTHSRGSPGSARAAGAPSARVLVHECAHKAGGTRAVWAHAATSTLRHRVEGRHSTAGPGGGTRGGGARLCWGCRRWRRCTLGWPARGAPLLGHTKQRSRRHTCPSCSKASLHNLHYGVFNRFTIV